MVAMTMTVVIGVSNESCDAVVVIVVMVVIKTLVEIGGSNEWW